MSRTERSSRRRLTLSDRLSPRASPHPSPFPFVFPDAPGRAAPLSSPVFEGRISVLTPHVHRNSRGESQRCFSLRPATPHIPCTPSHGLHSTIPLFPPDGHGRVSHALGKLRPFTILISSGTHPLCLVTPAITSAKIPTPHSEFHSQGGISILIDTLRQIARTHLIGYTTTNYDIEISHPCQAIRRRLCLFIRRAETHSRHTRTPATATTLAGESSTTHPATSTETTRAVVPHYGKPPRLPFYRDNHAPRLSVFGTPRHNTLRGPPGSSRRPRGAQQDASTRRNMDQKDAAGLRMACQCTAQATAHSEADGKGQRKGTGGIDRKSLPPVPKTRASLEVLFITA